VILHRVMEEAPLGSENAVVLLDEVYVTPVPKIGIYQVRLSNLDLGTEIYTISRIIRGNLGLLRYSCREPSAYNTIPIGFDL
jgi:hypothetical protein